MEKKMRITVRCGRQWKEVSFPITEEMEGQLYELMEQEEEETGEAFHTEGSRQIRLRIETFNIEKEF